MAGSGPLLAGAKNARGGGRNGKFFLIVSQVCKGAELPSAANFFLPPWGGHFVKEPRGLTYSEFLRKQLYQTAACKFPKTFGVFFNLQ